jgi:hypothetical protein
MTVGEGTLQKQAPGPRSGGVSWLLAAAGFAAGIAILVWQLLSALPATAAGDKAGRSAPPTCEQRITALENQLELVKKDLSQVRSWVTQTRASQKRVVERIDKALSLLEALGPPPRPKPPVKNAGATPVPWLEQPMFAVRPVDPVSCDPTETGAMLAD